MNPTDQLQEVGKNSKSGTERSPFSKPCRHINSRQKLKDWQLTVIRGKLIVGDSNLARIPKVFDPDLQIESYPGATFRHAASLLEKAAVTSKVQLVVLSFGINHRQQSLDKTATKQFQMALRAAREKFPAAKIWVPLVNFSRKLKQMEIRKLDTLNRHLKTHANYIPLLPTFMFKTGPDNIHWATHTAESMLDHWTDFFNY